jgi:hypothetical protein
VRQIQRVLAARRDSTRRRVWVHVDMDQFYAAVELKDRPELEGASRVALDDATRNASMSSQRVLWRG